MNEKNLTTKENDKTGYLINPRGLTMTLEIKLSKPMMKKLFDYACKAEHKRLYIKSSNRSKFLTDSFVEKSFNSRSGTMNAEFLLPFKLKVNDLEEAILIVNKYISEIFKRDSFTSFIIFESIKQSELVSCELKVSNMIVGTINVSELSVYKFDPVSNEIKEKIFDGSKIKEVCSDNSEKKQKISSALLDLTDLVESHFKQIKEVYVNYANMLLKNFEKDEKIINHCLNPSTTGILTAIDNTDKPDASTWIMGFYKFINENPFKRPVYNNFSFSEKDQQRISVAVSFLMSNSFNTINTRSLLDKLESNDHIININSAPMMTIPDNEYFTNFNPLDRNATTRYQVGLFVFRGKAFSFMIEKPSQTKYLNVVVKMPMTTESEDEIQNQRQEEIGKTIKNYSEYSLQQKVVSNINPSDVFDSLNYSFQVASKISMMTESYVEMLNRSSVLIDMQQQFKDILNKYELDEKEFRQQFLVSRHY